MFGNWDLNALHKKRGIGLLVDILFEDFFRVPESVGSGDPRESLAWLGNLGSLLSLTFTPPVLNRSLFMSRAIILNELRQTRATLSATFNVKPSLLQVYESKWDVKQRARPKSLVPKAGSFQRRQIL